MGEALFSYGPSYHKTEIATPPRPNRVPGKVYRDLGMKFLRNLHPYFKERERSSYSYHPLRPTYVACVRQRRGAAVTVHLTNAPGGPGCSKTRS